MAKGAPNSGKKEKKDMFEFHAAAASDNTQSEANLDRFLASVERRAYQMALLGCGNREDALDIVQDSMMKLVRKYRDKPEQEWTPLFYSILQSTLNDWYRRHKVRAKWSGFVALVRGDKDGDSVDEVDAIQQAPDHNAQAVDESLDSERAINSLRDQVAKLPLRQQQTFILRAWEGLSVEQTAAVMGCSQGSIKTHYSRAVQTLRQTLEDFL